MYFEQIRQIVANHMDLDPETITPESTLEDLKIDSLDMVEIIMNIEEELGVEMEELGEAKTLGQVADFVAAQKG
jgi:acyl carrier protein